MRRDVFYEIEALGRGAVIINSNQICSIERADEPNQIFCLRIGMSNEDTYFAIFESEEKREEGYYGFLP
jgi:hypothetical protein